MNLYGTIYFKNDIIINDNTLLLLPIEPLIFKIIIIHLVITTIIKAALQQLYITAVVLVHYILQAIISFLLYHTNTANAIIASRYETLWK